MKRYSRSRILISSLTLLLVTGCGTPTATNTQAPTVAATAAAAIPTEHPTAPATAVPPTATSVPPIATSTPAPTAVPPTPTTKPGLSAGTSIDVGPANVTITKIDEAATLPVSKKAPKAGTKFVQVAIKINSLKPGEQLASEQLVLTGASGTAYSPASIYSDLPVVGAAESASIAFSGAGAEFTAYFEVAGDEDVHSFTLSYQ